MGKKLYPTDTVEQARSILAAWDHIDPSLQFGPLTPESLSEELESVSALIEMISLLQIRLVDLRNQRDAACIGIWDKVKRTRAAIKGFYGDDSTEYELVGGRRLSDRKKHRRKYRENNGEAATLPEQAL